MMFDPRREALRQMVAARRPPPDPTTLPNTPDAIKWFQRHHGLVVDGIAGPKTRTVMRRTRTVFRATGPPLIPHRTTGGPAGHPIYNV